MRYLWPVILVLFVLFSVHFATQNSGIVVVRYSLDWFNFGLRSERPLFVTLYLTLALGILFSVLYFLVYHTKLLANIRKLRSEIKQLEKQLEQEQKKTLKLEMQSPSLQSREPVGGFEPKSDSIPEYQQTDSSELSDTKSVS